MNLKILGALLGSLILFSCQKKQLPSTVEAPVETAAVSEATVETAVEAAPAAPAVVEEVQNPELDKGKRLYMANCLQCHNRDPNIKGSIGPEVVDAPLEIMTSKIMTGKYPEVLPDGFVPKRKTKAMRAIPKLKDDIPAIWAWVQSVKKK